jgi:branched-subunit amino acid aminotransferase/4-amino-4-deoxychorismate lyase
VAIAISQVRWISPGFKTLSQQPLVMAKAEARRAGFFEPIFQNDRQELTEGATTNLFWVRRGILYTPAVTCGLLPGIVRRHVLALARRLRLPVREGRYFFKALAQADEIFLTNASLLVVPVVRVGRRSLLIGSMTRLLQSGLL